MPIPRQPSSAAGDSVRREPAGNGRLSIRRKEAQQRIRPMRDLLREKPETGPVSASKDSDVLEFFVRYRGKGETKNGENGCSLLPCDTLRKKRFIA